MDIDICVPSTADVRRTQWYQWRYCCRVSCAPDPTDDPLGLFTTRLYCGSRLEFDCTGFLRYCGACYGLILPPPLLVVEKSAAVSGSRVAERLLFEAYRFQALRPDAADVDERFPGNHRVKVSRSRDHAPMAWSLICFETDMPPLRRAMLFQAFLLRCCNC